MSSYLREILENVCYYEIFLSFLNDKEKEKMEQKVLFWSFIQFSFRYLLNPYVRIISVDTKSRWKYDAEKPKSIWMKEVSFTFFSRSVEVAEGLFNERERTKVFFHLRCMRKNLTIHLRIQKRLNTLCNHIESLNLLNLLFSEE